MRFPLDEFETPARAAEQKPFAYIDVPIKKATLVTDGSPQEAFALKQSITAFIPRLQSVNQWCYLTGEDYHNVGELLDALIEQPTDLIVTYRHLQEKSFIPQHSLGVYLDVLTQATSTPVLVLPGTAAEPISLKGKVCDRVMVVTDHILGQHALVNHGVRFCGKQPQGQGELWLCHVEDDLVFARYMRTISHIPEIDAKVTETQLDRRLLKEASDFIDASIAELKRHKLPLVFHSYVERGHRLRQYRELVNENQIELLVANTKDEDQLAMHGMAYSLSVELTHVAMLLL
jgi:hypothetical protein